MLGSCSGQFGSLSLQQQVTETPRGPDAGTGRVRCGNSWGFASGLGTMSVCVQGAALGRELRVAGGRKPPSQVLEDVEGQAAHQGDDSDLPQERQGGNEVNINKLVQEDQGSDVAGEAEQLSHDHEPVPRLDCQCHHQQLGENQRREGNGNNVHKFGFKEEECSIHDDATLINAYQDPD